ncbi:Protein of unknown function [Alkalithermobacter thermoalcaliphilus JW-YL-7 = DSM 7308]|uniref:DUF1292 domain-containing protein n=1 Tax=Alkalithermobacter thermoalcaliphilus JW-YL-7 = DSM 7308 TaxID=1121328 RepID=A0A150FRJ1_CLOPD|nr:protein of unknown function DUF1292 [[Clostridium] paradoxum JW-YL-7 = DSM 7308]SHK42016.1 Protein of unknown function [[Clostridium] paradoxum JW-YL-7 = DSM 7308]
MADKLVFLDEQGEKIELELIETLEVEGETYCLFAQNQDDEDAYVYKKIVEDGKEKYVVIEDEEEFERVLEHYNSYFDEE